MKKLSSLLFAVALALPVMAQAEDLNISNHTSYDLSFSFNRQCYSNYVPSRTIRSMPESEFNKHCQKGCEVEVYVNKTCRGQIVAKLNYDMVAGRVDLYGTGLHNISVGVSGFYHIFFSEPVGSN